MHIELNKKKDIFKTSVTPVRGSRFIIYIDRFLVLFLEGKYNYAMFSNYSSLFHNKALFFVLY